jgi:hypothetical protein
MVLSYYTAYWICFFFGWYNYTDLANKLFFKTGFNYQITIKGIGYVQVNYKHVP